ncbi:MAG TPA: HD domain-containing phosphohydrolase [Solirubrobacteraceae bacterium]|nr:HD domain-containing phosphohydrolase [Solirubrobacteraceae bacterium]
MSTGGSLRGWTGARCALVALAVLLAACAVHALWDYDAGPLAWLLEKWGYNVVLVGSGLLCLARGTLVRRERAAWLTTGVGVLGWAVGNVYYTAVLWEMDPIPIPSPSDVLWLVYYPIVYVAVALLLRARVARFHAALWVDGAVAALAVGALSAAVVFQSVLDTTGGAPLEVATNLAYPLGDLILLGMVTGGVALTGWKPGLTWGALAGSFFVFGICDGIYLWGNATGTWQAGSVFEAGWPAATLLLAWAAWMPPEHVRPRPLEGRRMLVVPTLFALLGLTLLISDHFHRLNLLAVGLAWASLLAVIGRFAMTFFANLAMLHDTREESLTDALTGLGNRRRLVRDLEGVLEAGRPGSALMLFDLNGFKGYNDVYGHPAGDALLARLGARLGAAVGPDARAYRMGGDEFCVLATLGDGDALGVLERGARALGEAGDGFEISAAHGCVLVPEEAEDAGTALGIADRRMYADKASARRSADEQSRDVLLRALEEHHPDLGDHVHDVGQLAEVVARELGLAGQSLHHVRQAAELHDIGKIAVPSAILDKPGKLDPEEWAFVARHTLIGERILGAALALRPVARIVRASHEHYDGTGYPDGLRGHEIPLGARIVSVCDAYDAMTSDRPYRARMSHEAALAELRRCAGAQFDPVVVEAFCRVRAERPTSGVRVP